MADKHDLSGNWHLLLHYFNTITKKTTPNEYEMRVFSMGNQVVMQSLPKDDESYFLLRMTEEGKFLTGTYYEQSSPKKEFKGKGYYGAVQLAISDDNTMEGRWAGFDTDMNIQDGDIKITRKKD